MLIFWVKKLVGANFLRFCNSAFFLFSKLGKWNSDLSFSSLNWRNCFQIALFLLDLTFLPLVNQVPVAHSRVVFIIEISQMGKKFQYIYYFLNVLCIYADSYHPDPSYVQTFYLHHPSYADLAHPYHFLNILVSMLT